MKGVIIVAAIIATAAALGACRREAPAPLKFGAELPVIEKIAQ
jgi:hypothetical protein